jgi:hypothetical protein
MSTAISFKGFKKTPAPASAPADAPASPTPTAPATPPVEVVKTVPAAAKTVAPTSTLAKVTSTDLADMSDDQYQGVGGFSGEFGTNDMRRPYLSICGPSSATFKDDPTLLGQFILNKTIPLGEVIRVVFFHAAKRYVEDLPYDPDAKTIPKSFNSRAEYVAAGFSDSQMKDVADLDLLVEVPGDVEGVDELADLFVGDKAYLLGRYTVQSTSYGKLVPVLMGDMKGFLKGNLVNGYYTLTTTKGSGKNLYFFPTPKTDGPTSIELRRAIVARVAPPV